MTQCCIEALYQLGRSHQPSVDLAKTFERRRCNHREAIAPDECVKDVIGQPFSGATPASYAWSSRDERMVRPADCLRIGPTNKHRYVLAAQSSVLRQILQSVPGLPSIHFNARGVLVLSPPSRATLQHKEEVEQERRMEGGKVLEGVEEGGNVVGGTADASALTGKRGRVKGPNPMSVRKKKKAIGLAEGEKGGEHREKKRKRRRENKDQASSEGEVDDSLRGNAEVKGEDGARRKKKRKRRGKGVVKAAIAEIRDGVRGASSD